MATTPQRQGFQLAVALLIFPMVLSGTCVDGQQRWDFRQTLVGRVPRMEADASFNDAGTPQCARHCTDLLGPRCRAMALHQERRECRVYSSPQASEETVQAPGFQVFETFPGFPPLHQERMMHQESSSPQATEETSQAPGFQNLETSPDQSGRRLDCREYFNTGNATSGVYTLHLQDGGQPFQAYCDMTTAGGGWTVFQRRRKDGFVNFNQTWKGYKEGFGNVSGEHWLGNDLLHRLTAAGLTELRVDLKDTYNYVKFAHYATFTVGDELSDYTLTYSGYNGNAGDALYNLNVSAFSTRDRDNDGLSQINCASVDSGGWWNMHCWYTANGKYFLWRNKGGSTYYLQASEMKLR